MLDLFKFDRFFINNYCKSFFVLIFLSSTVSLSAFEYQNDKNYEYSWIHRYFNSIDETTPIEEVIDFVLNLKASLEAKGYEVPSLKELCLGLRNELIQKGIKIDEEAISRIYNEISLKENISTKFSSVSFAVNTDLKFNVVKAKHRKKEKTLEVSDGFAIGFVKALGGALLCVIPHPVTIGIGSGLVLSGVNDMIQHAGKSTTEESDIENRLKNLPKRPD